jgi:hypothetical protein
MERAWDVVTESLVDNVGTQAHRLIAISFQSPPETSAESWVPVKSIAARLLHLFALPLDRYAGSGSGGHVVKSLLGAGERIQTRGTEVFEDMFLDMLLPMGFANGALFLQGGAARLRDFDLKKASSISHWVGEQDRRRILSSPDWAPSPGDFLGIRHHWWATMKLEDHMLSAERGNDFRKGNALRLAARVANVGAAGVNPLLASGHLSSQLSMGLMDLGQGKDDESQQDENLSHLIDLISLIAYSVRLNLRNPAAIDSLKAGLANLAQMTERQLEVVLGFVLFIGRDLFIYYLLLWEFVLTRDLDEDV